MRLNKNFKCNVLEQAKAKNTQEKKQNEKNKTEKNNKNQQKI